MKYLLLILFLLVSLISFAQKTIYTERGFASPDIKKENVLAYHKGHIEHEYNNLVIIEPIPISNEGGAWIASKAFYFSPSTKKITSYELWLHIPESQVAHAADVISRVYEMSNHYTEMPEGKRFLIAHGITATVHPTDTIVSGRGVVKVVYRYQYDEQ